MRPRFGARQGADGETSHDDKRGEDQYWVQLFAEEDGGEADAEDRCCKDSERCGGGRHPSVHNGHRPEAERRTDHAVIDKRDDGGRAHPRRRWSLEGEGEDRKHRSGEQALPRHELERCCRPAMGARVDDAH